jgi:hypothetical protein
MGTGQANLNVTRQALTRIQGTSMLHPPPPPEPVPLLTTRAAWAPIIEK